MLICTFAPVVSRGATILILRLSGLSIYPNRCEELGGDHVMSDGVLGLRNSAFLKEWSADPFESLRTGS